MARGLSKVDRGVAVVLALAACLATGCASPRSTRYVDRAYRPAQPVRPVAESRATEYVPAAQGLPTREPYHYQPTPGFERIDGRVATATEPASPDRAPVVLERPTAPRIETPIARIETPAPRIEAAPARAEAAMPRVEAPDRTPVVRAGGDTSRGVFLGNTADLYQPTPGPGMAVHASSFPAGEGAVLLVHEVAPATVRVGQAYAYEIHVTNASTGTLSNVIVAHRTAQNAVLASSTPQASRASDGGTQWAMGDLGPRETKVIRATARADASGNSSTCVGITFESPVCVSTQAVEPALAVSKSAPGEVLACDSIAIRYEVRNTGNGPAEGVRVRDALPEGLTVDGQGVVDLDAGTLEAGQSRTFDAIAKAARPGRYESTAAASGAGGLSAESARIATTVRRPTLEITPACPGQTYLGRDLAFQFTVKNVGDIAAANTLVQMPVPGGTQFARATEGGAASGGTVSWRIGTLAPGESKVIGVAVKPSGAEGVRVTATASAPCAPTVDASCQASVVGIPALLVEAIDLDDPIEVGQDQTYVITITNQGTAADSAVRLVCELPKGQEFVSSNGPTQATSQGGTVSFAPVGTLPPKAKIEYRVLTKATGPGDLRFRIRVTSEFAKEPVEETESTNQYR